MGIVGAVMATGDQEGERRAAIRPDAVSSADLVRRVELIARAQGVDLGQLRPVSGGDVGVEVDTPRGKVVVSLCAEDAFRVQICLHPVFAWSEGWTNDLVAAVGRQVCGAGAAVSGSCTIDSRS
ncbi:hypothetical protein BG418_07865 [Streptomyces sp. CBMA152]|nr:hypothetical protein [Streptomyces sp. CBMA152]